MTISGILGATGSDKPGDVFEQLILQLNEQSDNILENDCTAIDFNFYAKDRLPQHVVELYDRFTKFIALFYKYLECNGFGINASEYVSQGETVRESQLEMFKRLEIEYSKFEGLFKRAEKKGLIIKSGNNKKTIRINEDINIQIEGPLFLEYKILGVESEEL